MTPASIASSPESLLGHFLQILRKATLERMVLREVNTSDMDQRVLLDSHLVRTPSQLFAASRPSLY